jgi:hypothetical protein
MNICGHIISSDQVIGIGPAFMKSISNPTTDIYNAVECSFTIYLLNYCTTISETFKLGYGDNPSQEEIKARESFKEFKQKHQEALDDLGREQAYKKSK